VSTLRTANLTNVRIATPPDGEILDELGRQDILLLPHGLTGCLDPVEYRTIFPTRTVRYLAAARPILAHAPGDSFLASWLRQRDCAEIVSAPSEAAISGAVLRLASDAPRRIALARNAHAAAAEFDAATVGRRFLGVLAAEPRP
jgi:hypothetical protein